RRTDASTATSAAPTRPSAMRSPSRSRGWWRASCRAIPRSARSFSNAPTCRPFRRRSPVASGCRFSTSSHWFIGCVRRLRLPNMPGDPIKGSRLMARPRIEGSFVAVVTPFNRDGTVDYEGFRTNLAFQEEHGTAAVLILGSTGEVSLLSREERHDVIRRTVKMRRGAMKFFYGCTANNTSETIAMVNIAKAEEADGTILAAPSYIAASEADIERYFLEVADATDLPLGVYNNPPRVKTDLPANALLRIFSHPNFVVHKESTTRVAQVAQLLAARPD